MSFPPSVNMTQIIKKKPAKDNTKRGVGREEKLFQLPRRAENLFPSLSLGEALGAILKFN